jgi:hypothetical protein
MATDEVLRRVSAALGNHLRRMPDGEVGERAGWLAWQRRLFERHPLLETEPPLVGDYPPLPRFRLLAAPVEPSTPPPAPTSAEARG